jgi:hypothetical protein
MSNGRASIKDQQIADAKLVLESASRESGLDKDEFQRAVNNPGFKTGLVNHLKAMAVPRPKTDLLEPLTSTIEIPASAEFKAVDHFKVTPNEDRKTAEVVIYYLSDSFRKLFLQGEGKIETNVPAGTLRPHKLRRSSVDGPIISGLGGEAVVETTLAEMFHCMKHQGCGQKGLLLVNGRANIFYVRDTKGTLQAVHWGWDSVYEYWFVRASSITHPRKWGAGYLVCIRD